jgi:hypothetical protein
LVIPPMTFVILAGDVRVLKNGDTA